MSHGDLSFTDYGLPTASAEDTAPQAEPHRCTRRWLMLLVTLVAGGMVLTTLLAGYHVSRGHAVAGQTDPA